MPEKICPVCKVRISNWWSATGKTTKINEVEVHTACLQDFQLRSGREWSIRELSQEFRG